MPDEVKTSILDAFVRLVSRGAYDDVTISLICEEAAVARRTLYRHFPSKEDLVKGQIERDFIEPSRLFRASFPVDRIAQTNDILQVSPFLNMERRLPFYQSLLRSYGPGRLIEVIGNVCRDYSRDVWTDFLDRREDLEYVSFLFSWITAESAVWWLDGHTDIDPHQMARMMDGYGFAYWGASRA